MTCSITDSRCDHVICNSEVYGKRVPVYRRETYNMSCGENCVLIQYSTLANITRSLSHIDIDIDTDTNRWITLSSIYIATPRPPFSHATVTGAVVQKANYYNSCNSITCPLVLFHQVIIIIAHRIGTPRGTAS